MVLNNMPLHDAAIFGEPIPEPAGRVPGAEAWIRGKNQISPPTGAVIFEKRIQLKDLLEVTTTTEPNEKKKLRIRWVRVRAFDTFERLQAGSI